GRIERLGDKPFRTNALADFYRRFELRDLGRSKAGHLQQVLDSGAIQRPKAPKPGNQAPGESRDVLPLDTFFKCPLPYAQDNGQEIGILHFLCALGQQPFTRSFILWPTFNAVRIH
nr:hypothetical protein [Kiritimatiellia bacterium]